MFADPEVQPSLLADIAVRQVEAQVELQLVIARLHVRAQLVEGFVVLGLPQVRQFMDDDHP